VEVGGEADAAALGGRYGHELADGGEHGGDGLIVGYELLLDARFELIEAEVSLCDLSNPASPTKTPTSSASTKHIARRS